MDINNYVLTSHSLTQTLDMRTLSQKKVKPAVRGMEAGLNSDYAVAIYCGLKTLLQRSFHDSTSQHIYYYAFGAKSLQVRVSLRFFNPRHDAYCIIWVKKRITYL
jgi:hypothetical protein